LYPQDVQLFGESSFFWVYVMIGRIEYFRTL